MLDEFKLKQNMQLDCGSSESNVEKPLDIEKIVEKIQSNEEVVIQLFKKIDGKAQKGMVLYKHENDYFPGRDCEMVDFENQKVLEAGVYLFDFFEEVVLPASVVPFDAPLPPPLPSKTLLRLKINN